jgi:threonyl-tRNA synthetase
MSDAETQKIPYLVIFGTREVDAHTIAVRCHGGDDLSTIPESALLNRIDAERVTPREIQHLMLRRDTFSVLLIPSAID